MPATNNPLSTSFAATNEGQSYGTAIRRLVGITFRGTGLTAGQVLTIRNKSTAGQGSVIADYVIMSATDNADLWVGRESLNVAGVSLDNTTVGGTWVLTLFYDGFEADA